MVRIKHRYLLVHILFPEPLGNQPQSSTASSFVDCRRPLPPGVTAQSVIRSLRDEIALQYGDYGAGICAPSLSIKYLSPATSTMIIRCSRDSHRLVWSALTQMTHLADAGPSRGSRPPAKQSAGASEPCPCVFRVVRVSGTIRKAEEEAIRRARADILRARATGQVETLLGPEGATVLADDVLKAVFGTTAAPNPSLGNEEDSHSNSE